MYVCFFIINILLNKKIIALNYKICQSKNHKIKSLLNKGFLSELPLQDAFRTVDWKEAKERLVNLEKVLEINSGLI